MVGGCRWHRDGDLRPRTLRVERWRYARWREEDGALRDAEPSDDTRARHEQNNELAASIDRAEPVTAGLALTGVACLASGASLVLVSRKPSSKSWTVRPAGTVLALEGKW